MIFLTSWWWCGRYKHLLQTNAVAPKWVRNVNLSGRPGRVISLSAEDWAMWRGGALPVGEADLILVENSVVEVSSFSSAAITSSAAKCLLRVTGETITSQQQGQSSALKKVLQTYKYIYLLCTWTLGKQVSPWMLGGPGPMSTTLQKHRYQAQWQSPLRVGHLFSWKDWNCFPMLFTPLSMTNVSDSKTIAGSHLFFGKRSSICCQRREQKQTKEIKTL